MLPVNDFNFVVAGIATFAATVGYACTRRLSSVLKPESSSFVQPLDNQPNGNGGFYPATKAPVIAESSVPFTSDTGYTSLNVIPSLSNKDGLKRKVPHDGFEEPEKPVKMELGYPHNLTQIYPPNKRIKTPPLAEDVNTPAAAPIQVPERDSLKTRVIDEDLELPAATENFVPVVTTTPPSEPPFSPSPAPDSPSPTPEVVIPSPAISPDPQPTNPQPLARELVLPMLFASSSGGFAAFAGSTSPFSAVAGRSQYSAVKSGRPVWSFSASDLTDQSKSDEGVFDDTFRSVSSSNMGNVLEEGKIDTPLPTAKHTHLTGEEDEDIEMELKGAKLYVKRGEKSFGEGIPGHIKLLSHRTTSEKRILFRREPLWKVSMNVRLQPTVRCAFVPEENALKLILKETVDAPSADSSMESDLRQELVIYVLKPGRACSKKDFKEFADTLANSPHFRSVAVTCSSTAT